MTEENSSSNSKAPEPLDEKEQSEKKTAPAATSATPAQADQAAGAVNQNAAPQAVAPAPSNQNAAPQAAAPAPSNQNAAPQAAAPAPSNQNAAPQAAAPAPSNQNAAPQAAAPAPSNQNAAPQANIADKPLADELGIEDMSRPLVGGRGRIFSAAGPQSPVAEFTNDFLVMHPPQKPFTDTGPSEDILLRTDERGVLLDELGTAKHITGARFNGHMLWFLGENKPGTLKHLVGYFDETGKLHKLFVNTEPLTTDIIFRLRLKTHDGEISKFPDIRAD